MHIYAMPVFDMIETVLVKKLNFTPSFMLRFITRNIYVATTMFIGICFPFFGGLLSFFEGFAFAQTTYFIYLDPKARNDTEYKLETFSGVYRKLSGKDVVFEYPMTEA
ncbi:amino acid transporter, transmembrane domain-containing protein [Artemisia annua]|uniref:Amino acid transporter, transmembrane domain-containing protein n=1 Tax=Artemisia annua TaxID=35608 RepID=A0A2U1PFK6_ARTAN|nr:amino acid transporter, transmembrane domain-containing protein [Artemisia annua]